MVATACALALVACGGSGERQDADEVEGEFPVEITTSDFPTQQRLAQTSDLKLGVRNSGDEAIANLTVTIVTDPDADESFSVRTQQPNVAAPSRPVWVLENGYPRLQGEDAPAGAQTAASQTFNFGPLEPGDEVVGIWRLTPVQAGDYTIKYRIGAGLAGKARAVTDDGNSPEGEFVVRVTDVPPQTRVTDSGKVVPIGKGDIIGQAGTPEQKSELGGGGGGTATSP
jgi:hypothetical protein